MRHDPEPTTIDAALQAVAAMVIQHCLQDGPTTFSAAGLTAHGMAMEVLEAHGWMTTNKGWRTGVGTFTDEAAHALGLVAQP